MNIVVKLTLEEFSKIVLERMCDTGMLQIDHVDVFSTRIDVAFKYTRLEKPILMDVLSTLLGLEAEDYSIDDIEMEQDGSIVVRMSKK